jgi:DNA-binding transcriptional regulator YiaG
VSALEIRPSFDSTSAAGAMLHQMREPVIIGCMLVGLGTSTVLALAHPTAQQWQWPAAQTTAGAPAPATVLAGAAIGELRRLTGLTWEQLARFFNVSRRSLHFWASGKAMTPSNEEHLQRLLAVVRKIDRGSASENRTLLLSVREDGNLPIDLLAAGDYERVVASIGPGNGRKTVPPSKLSPEAQAARKPRPPEELVGALQDRIHPTSGNLLAARPIVTSRRK